MANTITDMFAPPTDEELKVNAPAPVARVATDLFAPPTKAELQPSTARNSTDMFAPPSAAELKPMSTVDKELQNRGAFDKPTLIPETIKQTDLDQIAAKHGVSTEDLRAAVPYFAGLPEDATTVDLAKGALGFLGTSAGLNVPQKLYKMSQDPKQEAALDELQNLIQGRRSYAQVGAEILSPVAGAVSAAGKLGKAALVGAGIGAGGGFGQSSAGDEVKDTVIGAGAGALIGIAGEKLVKYLGRPATSAEDSLLKGPRTRQVDLDKITSDAAARYGNSEAILETTSIGKLDVPALNRQETDSLLKDTYGDSLERFLRSDTDEGVAIRRSLGSDVSEEGIRNKLVDKVIDTRARDFAEEISGKRPVDYAEARKVITDQENRQGRDYVASRYKDYAEQQMVARQIDETGARAFGKSSNKVIEKVSASQYVLQHYDDVYGTKLGQGLSELSRDTNRSTAVKTVFRQGLDDIFQTANKLGRDSSMIKGAPIIRAIESGTIDILDDADKVLASQVSKQFDDIRKFANEQVTKVESNRLAPLSIPSIENYVSRIPVDVPEMVVAVTTKIDDLQAEMSKQLGKTITDLGQVTRQDLAKFKDTNNNLRDIVQFLSWKESEKYVPKSGAEMSGLLKESLLTQEGNIGLERAARAAMGRSVETPVPGFIRETNLYTLLDKYSNDVLSTVYKRRGLDMLRKESKKLESVGASAEAEYVKRIIQDTLGTRKGTAAALMTSIRREIALGLESKIAKNKNNPITSGALDLIKVTPDILSYLSRQIYPNALGWLNPRPILQNMLSGITRTAPELGGTYGYTTYLRGLVNGAVNFKTLNAESKRLGLIPSEFTRQGEQALAQGMRRSGAANTAISTYEKAAKYGMALYQKSEELNRVAILGTAQMMANDIARGSKLALKGLTKFPNSVQKRVAEAAGNPAQVYEILAKHLNDRTAFNYDRQSMFELGRELGPIFSTFSKWPTEIAGEAIYDLRSKGALRGAGRMTERLMTPILALGAIDFIVNEQGKDTDAYKKIVGNSGFKSAAPANSLVSFVGGSIFTPPMVDAVMQGVVVPITSGDGPKLGKGLETMAYSYLPGAGLLKRLTEDLSTIIEDEKPDGSGTTERILEATRKFAN